MLTVPVRVGHNNIPCAELGEELLHELERRVVLDSKWRLVHIAGEVIRILAEDDRARLRKGRHRRHQRPAMSVRVSGVEGDFLLWVVRDDTQCVLQLVRTDVANHTKRVVIRPKDGETAVRVAGVDELL